MFGKYSRNTIIKKIMLVLLLVIGVYAFLEWREFRLERRAKMLHQETLLDLSKVGDEGSVEFLIDSHTGQQYVYIDVYTPVGVLEKDIIQSSQDTTKKMYVDIYTKYKEIDKNPNKYQDWKNVELEVVIRNKANKNINIVKRCFPYQYRETTVDLPLRSRCNVRDISNGLYVVDVKVLSSNIDFEKNKSRIIFAYSGVGDYTDFYSRVFDSILKDLLGLMAG